MISQVLLGLFGISLAYGLPLEGYYVNTRSSVPNEQFYYNYQLQPRSTYFYPNDINNPEIVPELGMSPQYHDLVYNYVKDFAGTQPASHVNTYQPFIYNNDHTGIQQNAPEEPNKGTGTTLNLGSNQKENDKEVTDKPGLKDYYIPSDFLSLPNNPKSQFYGHIDAIKMKRTGLKAHPTSLPPINGVISNYVLQRDQKTPQNSLHLFGALKDSEANLQHIKRQTPDNSDGVVIYAESSQNTKTNDDVKEESDDNKDDEEMAAHPGIAQSKPAAIALAGPGGMAQASPVGTALVGQGGLAVAAPSGTAVAGPAGQGAIPILIGGGEKQRKEPTGKTQETDSD